MIDKCTDQTRRAEERRSGIVQVLADVEYADRIQEMESKRKRIGDEAWRLRCECLHCLARAMALGERVFVHNGIVVVTGTRGDELARVLRPYNRIIRPFTQSLAAFYVYEVLQ